jgi:hypothetical protein
LAEELEAKGDLRAAEEQFLLAGNWVREFFNKNL